MEKERYFIHFKGGLYKMLGIAQHSEALEEMVVYQALYGKHEIWVRPKTMFFDKVVRNGINCLLYTSPSPRDRTRSRMPSSA